MGGFSMHLAVIWKVSVTVSGLSTVDHRNLVVLRLFSLYFQLIKESRGFHYRDGTVTHFWNRLPVASNPYRNRLTVLALSETVSKLLKV